MLHYSGKTVKLSDMDGLMLANEATKLSVLSTWEHAQVIDGPWQSLDPEGQATVDQAWLAESHGRLLAHREGKPEVLDGTTRLKAIEVGLKKWPSVFFYQAQPKVSGTKK